MKRIRFLKNMTKNNNYVKACEIHKSYENDFKKIRKYDIMKLSKG